MPASYSYIDVATLDAVRERFAAGEALAILSTDLDQVIWANGPGAVLLGYADIGAAIGASSQLGLPAKRQIAATSGFPKIGRDRALMVRLATGVTSSAVALVASSISLPDGEAAILLAAPIAQPASRSRADLAERAISGFTEPGQFTALLDGNGKVEAASPGFDGLGIGADALAKLAAEGRSERDRVVRRAVEGSARALPAGLARLGEEPARFLLVVIDEVSDALPLPAELATDTAEAAAPEALQDDQAGVAAENPAADAAPDVATDDTHNEDDLADDPTLTLAAGPPAAVEAPAVSHHDEWYFSADGKAVEHPPVRFVWRTDADGRFSVISHEFASAVGARAADVVGQPFGDVAAKFKLDPDGEIAGLLERRDTWSGRSVLWPVAGTDLKVPVDLAALPAYGRDRTFEGFRGFGVARPGDAIVDAEAIGLTLKDSTATETTEASTVPVSEAAQIAGDSESNAGESQVADPFKGEVPVLDISQKQDRRYSDKVIRLAEHRQPANDKGLSSVERNAFREIGERLRRDNGAEDGTKQEQPAGATDAQTETGAAESLDPPATQNAEPQLSDADLIAEANDSFETDDLAAIDGVSADDVDAAGEQVEAAGESDPVSLPSSGSETSTSTGNEVEPALSTNDVDASADTPSDVAADLPATSDAAAPAEGTADVEQSDARPQADTAFSDHTTARPRARSLLDFMSRETEPADAETAAYSEAIEAQSLVGHTAAGPIAGADTIRRVDDDADNDTAGLQGAADDSAGHTAVVTDTSILDKLPVPVLIHAGDTLHHANDEFLALTGYGSLDELAEAGGLAALFAATDADHVDGADHQMRLSTRDGHDLPVNAHLRSVPWGGGKALMLVVQPAAGDGREVPAMVQPAVADLQARVAEMRTIIDTATDGVVLIAPDGNIRSISRPAEALFGFDSDDVTGKPFAALFAIESQRAARDYLSGLSEHGVASVLNDGREVIGREAEGRFIPLFMTIGRLPGDSGYCAVVRDITQWKRAEEDLTQARAMAERASSQKSDFLARVSHEIRTPLNAIIGFSELMIDEKFGPVANDRYRDYLRDINRSGNHVLDLVNDLLDISKIEAGQQEMSYEAVSLNDTLAETVAMMQPQANRERVIIRSSFASKLPEVVADLRSVRQIALNILSNAVRYTQAGGQVIVSTAYEASGDVVMRVRDTGIGMSQAEIEQALKPFKQINALKRGRNDGTGLGLPLTKAMVEANRAKFSLLSTPGEGTLVEISFPSTRVLAQ